MALSSVAGERASNPGGHYSAANGPEKAIDDNTLTAWVDSNQQPLVVEFPDAVYADEFAFTTAIDCPDRDPVRWNLTGSQNGSAWVLLHTQTADYSVPAGSRPSMTQWFAINSRSTSACPTTNETSLQNPASRRRYSANVDTVGTLGPGVGSTRNGIVGNPTAGVEAGRGNVARMDSFKQITFGSCSTWSLYPITGPATCEVAAQQLGLGDTSVTVTGASDRPEGCYYYRDAELWLGINPDNEGYGVETSSSPPIGSRMPICSSQPQGVRWAVSSTNGVERNAMLSMGITAILAIVDFFRCN